MTQSLLVTVFAMLTALAAAAPDPATPWWITFLATAGPVLGVIIGALLGPLVEPWKLGAAHRAHVRKECLIQCARLVESASRARAFWTTNIQRSLDEEHVGGIYGQEREMKLSAELYVAREEMHGALMLLRLYARSDLAQAANNVVDLDNRLLTIFRSSESPLEDAGQVVKEMRSAIADFSIIAKRCVV